MISTVKKYCAFQNITTRLLHLFNVRNARQRRSMIDQWLFEILASTREYEVKYNIIHC